ncbi:MAG: hypothetical protein AB7I18_00790 [Candidatus Berkiella sp.]
MAISPETFDVMSWIQAKSSATAGGFVSALVAKYSNALPNNITLGEVAKIFNDYEEHIAQRGLFSFSFNTASDKHVSEFLDWLRSQRKTDTLLLLWKLGAAKSDISERAPLLSTLEPASYEEYDEIQQCASAVVKSQKQLFNLPYENPALWQSPAEMRFGQLNRAVDAIPDRIRGKVLTFLLSRAIDSDNDQLLKDLIRLNSIPQNAYEQMLYDAIIRGKSHIAETLIASDHITKQFDPRLMIAAVSNGDLHIARLMLPYVMMLGLPLQELLTPNGLDEFSEKIAEYDLRLFIDDPITFLTQHFKNELKHPSMLTASKITSVNEQVRLAEANYRENSETAMSPRQLSAAAIAYDKADNLYKSKLEEIAEAMPAEQRAAIELQENPLIVKERYAIEQVEQQIRGMLLDKMLADNPSEQITDFIQHNREALVQGQDQRVMTQAQSHFQSNTNPLHIAWRAYDAFAPTVSWINLFTPPVDNSRHEFGAGDKSTEEVTWDVRRRAAIYYLALQDKASATLPQEDREAIFIGEIAEIRRAHNYDNQGTDNPSCYPGTIGRIAKMGGGHNKLLVIDPIEELSKVIQSLLQQRVNEMTQDATPQKKELIYWSLVALLKSNLETALSGKNVLKQQKIPEHEWVAMRQEILEGLGTNQQVFDKINEIFANSNPKIRPLAYDELVYVTRQLVDINHNGVGLTVAEKFKPAPALQNPYAIAEPKTPKPLSQQEALRIMNSHLQGVENKTAIMMKAAQLVSKGNSEEAITALKQSGIVPPKRIEIIQEAITIAQQAQGAVSEATKSKAQLWEELNEAFMDTTIENKGDTLKSIVDKVVDKKVKLEDALAKHHLALPKQEKPARPKALLLSQSQTDVVVPPTEPSAASPVPTRRSKQKGG